MTTSRPVLARRVLGLAAVPALLLGLAACGDDDDSAGGDFCDQASDLNQEMADVDFTDQGAIGELTDRLDDIDPPEAIAEDWDTMLSAFEAYEDVDLSDPAALEEIQSDPAFANIEEASTRVEDFMNDECDL